MKLYWKDVCEPKIILETKLEVPLATITQINSSGEKNLWISSSENITPASGALNVEEIPALAPQVTRYFSSASERLASFFIPDPTKAPKCTEGPSRPIDIPAPIANIPPTNFVINSPSHLNFTFFVSSPLTCGIPLPLINGYLESINCIASPNNIKTVIPIIILENPKFVVKNSLKIVIFFNINV